MKKAIIGITLLLLFVMGAVGYHQSYPISRLDTMKPTIQHWLNRGYDRPYYYDITLYDEVTIGKFAYIPMEAEGELGYALLRQGLTGRYRLETTSHGTGNICTGIVEIDGQNYLMLEGRNTTGLIERAVFSLEIDHGDGMGKIPITYTFDIPHQPVFFLYQPIEKGVITDVILIGQLKLYNTDGEDITSQFYLSGGRISAD